MKQPYTYYSNAKFLLTGEYLVLQGALALAVPLKYGQKMEIYESGNSNLIWTAYVKGKLWLDISISQKDIDAQENKGATEKDFLCFILNRAKYLNPEFLKGRNVYVKTEINFDRNWGLGSSSSLINNIAQWASVNPFELHSLVSNGSGYDVACASYSKPILFRRNGNHPLIYPVDFHPDFSRQFYFVYLGKKQDSEDSVNAFLDDAKIEQSIVNEMSQLSKDILNSNCGHEFDRLIENHELLVSTLLNRQMVKEYLFPDFEGAVKSLGAWGGDFVLVRSELSKREIQSYFFSKGLTKVFSWKEMVLS